MATEAEYWNARAILELTLAKHPFTDGNTDELRKWIRKTIEEMGAGDLSEDLYSITYEEMGLA